VRAPTEAVGRLAAEELFKVLSKQGASGVTLLPTELIIRRSCGCEISMSLSDDKKEVIHPNGNHNIPAPEIDLSKIKKEEKIS
jgi:hypothetical protein